MFIKRWPIHAPASSSPSSSDACLLDGASTACEPIKNTVVVENELSIEGSPDVEFDEVAAHTGGESEGLESVLWHVAVGGAMAKHLHLAPLQYSGMAGRDTRCKK